MERKVVIDSSPIIGLVLVGGLEWLPSLLLRVFARNSQAGSFAG
jgi:hypothetical protein